MKSLRILYLFAFVAVVTASPAVRRVKILRSQRQMVPVYGPPPEEPIGQPSEQVPPQVDETISGLSPPTEAPQPKLEEPEDEDSSEDLPMMTKGLNFFPVNLGRSSGGSIAIGNSFSTGKGGKAESHATAYGTPARLEMPPDSGYKYDRPTPSFEEEPTELPSETVTETITTTEAATESATEPATEPSTPKPTTPKPKRKSPRKNPSFDLGNIPFGNFFPITFGRSGFPGGSTAIANSFSTGRKGNANSHATSFGSTSARLEAPPQGTMLVGFFDESMKQPKFFTFQMGQNMAEQPEAQPEETQPDEETQQPEQTPVEDSEEDSDEEDESGFNFGFGKSAGGLYNFFPISFGASPASAAVANSFTTGRKGTANSHATSNGKSARLEQQPDVETEEESSGDAQLEDEPSDEVEDETILKELNPSEPSYSFFPIVFAGFQRNSGNGISSTAIANSFSTGKKGAATSHATSFGSGKSARLENPPEASETATEITISTTDSAVETTEVVETTEAAVIETEAPVETPVEPQPPKRKSKSRPINNSGTGFAFFPISFGRGRSGSSISVANSFSTGKNGAANSYATSYGSARTKRSPQAPEDIPEELPAEELPTESEDLPEDVGEEQNPDENPLGKGFGGYPYYNFFPINFSYGSRSGDEGNDPGTVAIANSFSTGRGGVANSHATAYGFGIPKNGN